jgi:hypothetical protein
MLIVSGIIAYLIGKKAGRKAGELDAAKKHEDDIAALNDQFFGILREGAKEDGEVVIKMTLKEK